MIPSLVGRMPLGTSESHELGSTGGSETVTLTTEQMPSHNHSISESVASSGEHIHSYQRYIGRNDNATIYGFLMQTGNLSNESISIDSANAHTHTLTATIGNTGSGQGHNNMPPFLTLNFIIKT